MATNWDGLEFDAHGFLRDISQIVVPDFPPPPDYTWSKLDIWELTTPPFGQVVALSDQRGIQMNLRVASEPWVDTAGRWVRIVTEQQWQQWVNIPEADRTPLPTRARAVPTRCVYVMHPAPRRGTPESADRC